MGGCPELQRGQVSKVKKRSKKDYIMGNGGWKLNKTTRTWEQMINKRTREKLNEKYCENYRKGNQWKYKNKRYL